jgi:hypothetical protein
MTTPPPAQPDMISRIERALLLLAYFIELDGDVHVPMYEKFESELQELRKTEDARSRARRLLLEYSQTGGVKSLPELIINTGCLSTASAPCDLSLRKPVDS